MKVKNIFISIIATLFFSGCQVTAVDYISHDGRLNQRDVTLVASGVLNNYMTPTYYRDYNNGYYYDSVDDIIIDSYIGDVTVDVYDSFYGYTNSNPYRGNMVIVRDYQTIYLDVIDQYHVNVRLIDDYDSSYGIEFVTTWIELGF